MRKKIREIFWLAVALLLVCQPVVVSADLPNAVSFLKNQTADPWITQALVAAGESEVALDHLASVSGTLATDYAKAILALAAAGENPATYGNIDYVAKLKTYFSDNQMGDSSLLNDDAWSILALAAVGENESQEINGARNFLLANQNSDGGWSYQVGGDSDTNDTAAIVVALIEAGVSTGDNSIVQAMAYLQSIQNNDGGFGWAIGSASDSGSDAWVISAIYKASQDPADWTKNDNTPLSHLWSLQDSDGGFWWVEPDTSDFNNKAMTAYTVIALSGKSFPVGYYEPASEEQAGVYHVRIEGEAGTICDSYADGITVLDVTENASVVCGFTYEIEDTSYGPYLKKINDEEAAGMSGWMFFVNYESAMVGAADYTLSTGDDILWYYGEWGWQPTRLSVNSNNLDSGAALNIQAEYYDGGAWLSLEDASLLGSGQEYTTDNSGQATVYLSDGIYNLFIEKAGFVRSNKEDITIGSGVSQDVSMTVEVDQGQTTIAGESIIFSVSPSQLNFGKMSPSETSNQNLNLSNEGTVNLMVSSNVAGDSLFVKNIKLDNENWNEFNENLLSGENHEVGVSLTIPSDYLGSGVKTGELIFWAQAI